MKKNNARSLLFKTIASCCLIMLFIITACKKNDVPPPLEQKELEQWYNQNKSLNNVSFSEFNPIWTSAYINEQPDELTVYEIKLSNPKNIYQRLDDKISKEDAISRNNIRLLIFKDKSTGQIITGCYMSVINEVNQLQDLSKIHYKQMNNLNGKIMFFNMDGKLVNG